MAACGRREGLDRDGVDRGGAREKASEWRSRLNVFTVFFGLRQRHVGGGFLDPLVNKGSTFGEVVWYLGLEWDKDPKPH